MTSLAWANAKPISGVVVDKASKEPLIGCVVQVKDNKTVNTTTGLDGSFSLNFDDAAKGRVTLLVSYLGYKNQEVVVDLSATNKVEVSMAEDSKELGEVVVTGVGGHTSDASAVNLLKNSNSLLNVMSQQALQLSPDVNVASALRRVSGVVMQDDGTGEASYAILRGMDKRYNYSLVNGIKIPSPDDKNRYVPLNLFPSHLMDRLVVYKTLTPDMEGDAAGGAINMDMRDAPNSLRIQADFSLGSNDFFWGGKDYMKSDRGNTTSEAPYEHYGPDYRATTADFKNGGTQISTKSMPMPNIDANFSIGNRWWNKRFGAIFAGSFQNTFRGMDRTVYTPTMAAGEQAMYISKLQQRNYSIHDLTTGLHAKFDLRLSPNQHIEWYNMYVHRKEDNTRYSHSIVTDYGYDAEKGNYTRNDEMRTNTQTQDIFATNLKGTHTFGNFTIDWAGIFASAKEKDPDRTYVTIYNAVEGNEVQKTLPASMERRFQHNSDRNWEGHLNMSYTMPLQGDDNIVWKIGGMYRNKRRNNRYYSYLFNPTDISQQLEGNGNEQFAGISWTCRTPAAQASQLNYNSKERIGGTYAMATINWAQLEIVGGLRAEHTNQIYTMLQKFDDMGRLGEQSYWDYLPSLAVKYQLNKQMDFRASYYKSINRPGFYEIVPYQIDGEDYIEKGNPTLKRARIHNADLRFEWFPSATEQVLVGAFYKYLKDPIETSFTSGTNGNFYQPQNLGNARNVGFEIDVVKYIRHFGVKANYTYTHSEITTKKRRFISKSEVEMVDQSRPLVNQAAHTANVSLLYKDTEHGWNAQLASAYTGKRLVLVSPYKDADEWERGRFTLDLSLEKNFKCGLSFFAKANNLTDAKVKRYLKTVNEYNLQFPGQDSDDTNLGERRYGRTFLVGVRFKL